MTGHTPDVPAAAAAELQQLLLDTEDVEHFLQRLVVLAVDALPGDVSCGLTLRRGRRPMTVASSDNRANLVDEVQYGFDDGPCLTSLASGRTILIDNLAEDTNWPGYRISAVAHGVRSSLSIPVSGGDTLGALNFYASTPYFFGPTERTAAARFATEAGYAVTLSVRLAERAEMTEHLQAALASRAVIDQALGVIMTQQRCSPDEAFDLLRGISQTRNVKVREVAVEIVTAVSGRLPISHAHFR
jgi:GAF domain-containing protein